MDRTPDDEMNPQAEGERLKAESDKARLDFFRTDLAACFNFASLAETEYKTGGRDAAERALADAEKGYATLFRFMSDPKHASHIGDEDRRELTAGLERLRAKLDELRRL